MSNPTPKTPEGVLGDDEVRDLFSDHLEGALDAEQQQRVDEALARNPLLLAERQRFEKTVALLRTLPRDDAPPNLVANVRARLAVEQIAKQGGHLNHVESSEQPSAQVIPLASRRRSPLEYVAGFAALAAAVAFFVVGVPALQQQGQDRGAGADGVMTAGAGASSAVSLSWRAPGLHRGDVVEAAQQAGLSLQDDGSFAGDRQSAARFLVALKTRAASLGSELSAQVPETAEHVVVVVNP